MSLGLGLAHVGDGAVGVGGIEQDGAVAAGDDVLEMGRLLGGVILRIEHGRVVAQLLGAGLRGLAEHDEPRVVQRGDDDGDPRLAGRGAGGWLAARRRGNAAAASRSSGRAVLAFMVARRRRSAVAPRGGVDARRSPGRKRPISLSEPGVRPSRPGFCAPPGLPRAVAAATGAGALA